MRKRQFLFRLFYSTSFTILLIIEILLLLISPGDIIYQSFAANRHLSIVAVAIVYVAVLLVSAFIIATRFYTAHTQLTGIPRSYIPIRKGDLSKSLRRLIVTELSRSASIAYHAHPREIQPQDIDSLAKETARAKSKTITWSLNHMKSWREIKHPGWSSPCAPDLPDLQFEPIFTEFPHLIEAKAVTLAPPDPLLVHSTTEATADVLADPRAIDLLRRPASMSLRQYVARLESLEMIDEEDAVREFLSAYESARFSKNEISESNFRSMLDNFTKIMQELKPPSEMALEKFYGSSPSLSPASSRSVLRSRTSRRSMKRASTAGKTPPITQNPILSRDIGEDQPTPMSRSLTPFLTPKPYMYPASLSSGHAGDRSSDSSDSERDHSIHTAFTRLGRYPTGATNTSRHASATGSVNLGTGAGSDMRASHSDDGMDDNGSVIRRTSSHRSNRSDLSDSSNLSGGSVIHRADERELVLPLPMINDTGYKRGF